MYLIPIRGVEICVAYITVLCGSLSRWFDFIRSIMSENCVISALPSFYGIYSDQKYKNQDDTIIMIM